MNTGETEKNVSNILSMFMQVFILFIIVVFVWNRLNRNRVNQMHWRDLFGDLYQQGDKLTKSQQREANIEKKRYKKRNERERSRIGQC